MPPATPAIMRSELERVSGGRGGGSGGCCWVGLGCVGHGVLSAACTAGSDAIWDSPPTAAPAIEGWP